MKATSNKDKDRERIRETIRNGVGPAWAFTIMNMLSAAIATYGLFSDSPAVVIGAMIVAMRLGPIVGVAIATFVKRGLPTFAILSILAVYLAGTLKRELAKQIFESQVETGLKSRAPTELRGRPV